jgi:hypothetical protein
MTARQSPIDHRRRRGSQAAPSRQRAYRSDRKPIGTWDRYAAERRVEHLVEHGVEDYDFAAPTGAACLCDRGVTMGR